MCFESPFLIIVGDCSTDTPQTTVVLNRLPGISFKTAAKVANEDWVTGVKLLRELEIDAFEKVSFDVLEVLSDRFQFKSILASQEVGRRSDTFTAISDEVGLELTRSTVNGQGLSILLPSIEIGVDADVSVTLNINVDGVLTTKDVDLKKDSTNHIELDLEGTKLIQVTYNPGGTGVSSTGSHTSNKDCEINDFCCNGCFGIRSVELDGTYVLSSKPNGIVAHVACKADECQVFHFFKEEMAVAVRLQVAISLMQEVLASGRTNPTVANGESSAREMLHRWEGGTDPISGFERTGDYPKRIKQLSNITANYLEQNMSKGFDCNKIRVAVTLP